MKVGILAGGLGTRLFEETVVKPKPMIEIGGKPLLWHIMHIYSHYGFNEFVIALGYKGDVIRDYFTHYQHRVKHLEVSTKTGEISIHNQEVEDWKIHLLETGESTDTGGRVGMLAEFCDETFMLTYGDGVGNVDIDGLLNFHLCYTRIMTLTAVRPPVRFGHVKVNPMEGYKVETFAEKPHNGEGWVNGGFFVIEPSIAKYIRNDGDSLESTVLPKLVEDNQVGAFEHEGFWQCMDTPREVLNLNEMWKKGKAEWKIW